MLTKDESYHAWTKHMDMHYHFIHFIVDKHSLLLVYCPIGDIVANTLIKALPALRAKHFAAVLRLHTI